MKRFVFKLQSVLEYRKLLEERAQEEVAGIRAEILRAEEVRKQLFERIDTERKELEKRSRGVIDIEKVRNLVGYLERLRKESLTLAETITKLERDCQVAMDKLLESRRNREVVDKLKENSIKAHTRETLALEQKLLDELSVARFGQAASQTLPRMFRDSED